MLEVLRTEALEHLRARFPDRVDRLGPRQARRVVDLTIERAARHGLTTTRDVCLYLNLMLRLGSRFDDDPQFPWARRTLADTRHRSPSDRLCACYDEALRFLQQILGPGGSHVRAVIDRIPVLIHELESAVPAEVDPARALALLRRLYPEKCKALGEPVLEVFLLQAMRKAARSDLATPQDVLLHVGACFMLGFHFDEDPQYPWTEHVTCSRDLVLHVLDVVRS